MEKSPAAQVYRSPDMRIRDESIRIDDKILTKSSAGKENFSNSGNKSLGNSNLIKRKKQLTHGQPQVNYEAQVTSS